MLQFQKVSDLSVTLKPRAIESAVEAFITDGHLTDVPTDKVGLFNQLIENIAAVVVFKQPGRYFWLAEEDGEVIAFSLTHISKDVDNSLCYWMTDAWVAPKWRRRPEVKRWFKQLREDAKQNLCKHIIIPSSRNVRAYCRFLGKGWHEYVTLLKEDI